MSDFNPYSAPESEIVTEAMHLMEEGGLWRDAKLLVVRKGVEFPDRCIACNDPAEGYRLKRKLSWHPPGWYLIIFFNLIIYIVVALCVRWTARIAAPLCPRHRSRRRRAILLGWVGSLSGLGMIIFGASNDTYAAIAGIGAVAMLGFLLYGIFGSQYLVPRRIDKNFVWLRKVSPEFLAALPEWN